MKYAVSAEWNDSPKSNGAKKSLFTRVCNYRDHSHIRQEVKIEGKMGTEFITITFDIQPHFWTTLTYRTDLKEINITQNFTDVPQSAITSITPIVNENQDRKTTLKNYFEVAKTIQEILV